MSKSSGSRDNAVYLRAMTEDVLGWDDSKTRLKNALAEDNFLLYAQRIRSLKPGPDSHNGCEILLRLREEEDNMLPPGGFFPVAEALGMLEDIDRWVVAHTISWCVAHANGPMCCINLSTDSIRNPSFAGFVRRQINLTHLPGQRLCFEINEADALAEPAAVRSFVKALKPLDCRFTLDHFGSIKVSFVHLANLPVDFLKIDGSIIQNILKSPGDLARARAISLTCQRLKIRTIAQNVERKDILIKLREIGYNSGQGFGIARPCPIDRLKPV